MGISIGVVGSRSFNDYDLMVQELSRIEGVTSIVSGGANGADKLAERYAREHGLPITVHLPDWDRFGRRAGLVRNMKIVNGCDALIAFWDGESKGTKDSIRKAELSGKPVTIVRFKEGS